MNKEHKITCHHRTSHIHDNSDFKCRCMCTCFIPESVTPTEDWEKEFDKKFSSEWWTGFGTTKEIDQYGIKGLKSFIRSEKEQSRQEDFDEVIRIVEGMMKPICRCMCEKNKLAMDFNRPLSDILTKLKEVRGKKI